MGGRERLKSETISIHSQNDSATVSQEESAGK